MNAALEDDGKGNGGVFDDFDDVFGAGFEDLSDDEEGGACGEEAERELHAKVWQQYPSIQPVTRVRVFTVCFFLHYDMILLWSQTKTRTFKANEMDECVLELVFFQFDALRRHLFVLFLSSTA